MASKKYRLSVTSKNSMYEKAWEFYYNYTLPRRVQDDNGKWRIAEPGEPGGQLYSVWGTSVKDLGDFGLGIGLYFSTLAQLSVLCFLAGCVLIVSIEHFKSDSYGPKPEDLDWKLKGSAVCQPFPVTNVYDPVTATGGHVGVLNPCFFESKQAAVDIVMTLMFAVFCVVSAKIQDKLVEALDESQQTTQDYAVMVEDPGPEDSDPDMWYKFFNERFSSFGEVVYVTVAKDNGALLSALANLRYLTKMVNYEDMKGDGTVEDTGTDDDLVGMEQATGFKKFMQMAGFGRDIVYWKTLRKACRERIAQLRVADYKPVCVFVIFNTESAQRACLSAMTTGLIPAMLDWKDEKLTGVESKYLFNGNLLEMSEPVEPSEVIYENLHYELKQRVVEQTFTLGLSCIVLVISFFVIEAGSKSSGAAGAIIVSLINVVLPMSLKIITSFEHHIDAGNKQESMLNKLVVARMMNTAIMIYILTDFNETLSSEAISKVMSILFADAVTAPTLRLLDIGGRINKLYVSKSSLTQEKANSFFTGAKWNLAERYTDTTKTLFVSLFYAGILPAGLFVSGFAFMYSYWVDKYCLLRQWETPPALDDSLATKSRGHLVFCLFVHLLITANYYAGWSFDNICIDETSANPLYFCGKAPGNFLFPKTQDWMGSTQENMTKVYGVGAFVVFIFLIVFYFGKESYSFFTTLFRGGYDAVGDDQGIAFASVSNIQTYVPQIRHPGLQLPLLACDLSLMNTEHISWSGDFEANNLFSGVDMPGVSLEDRRRIFSVCKYYPPKGNKNSAPISTGGVSLQVA